jgi:hypothetical protein
VVGFKAQPLQPQDMSLLYPLDRSLCRFLRLSGYDDKEKKSLPCQELKPQLSDILVPFKINYSLLRISTYQDLLL